MIRPDDDDPWSLPEALVAAERWEPALEAISAALARRPQDARLLGLLVRTLRGLRRPADAVTAARGLLTAAPQDPYAFRLATLVLLDVGWVDEAVGLAARAVALDPAGPANHLALAQAWGSSNRPGAVARQLAAAREAVALAPNSPDAHVAIGVALAADGDPQAARLAYLEALRLDPNHPAALNNLAVLALDAGAPEDAARHLAAALAADPHGPTALRNLDAVALRVIRRLEWWMALAPVPALALAAAGQVGAARVLGLLALLALPAVLLRWWRALTAGQRTHLRALRRRVRRGTWAWPVAAGLLGGTALVRASFGAPRPIEVVGYALVVGYLLLLRSSATMGRRGWRPTLAGWRVRLRRWARLGRGERHPGP